LPLRRIALEVAARPDDPGTLEIASLNADLGGDARRAGTLSGSGRWTHARWNLDATLADVRPDELDARAPRMRLSGPLHLSGAADPAATAASAQTFAAQADLRGRLDGRPNGDTDVALRLDAGASAQRIELRRAEVEAGRARATLSGTAERASAPDAPWHVDANAALAGFDPAPWWPAAGDGTSKDSPWRRGASRLDATARIALDVPSAAPSGGGALAWLSALRGRADATVARGSLLAGVPLAGTAQLRNDDGARLNTTLDLDAAGNALHAQGRLATRGSGADDAWHVQVDAAALERLAPLAALLRSGDGLSNALAGRIAADARIAGRWPAGSTRGRLEVSPMRSLRSRFTSETA
jgi:translocation and assembly module TamB